MQNIINTLRILSLDMVELANSGHPGMPMGMADVVTVLYQNFINFNPKDPKWLLRDRFVLSAGHGSALLYSLLFLTGYVEWDIGDLKQFRQLNSKTPGHPEYNIDLGIETTTGPLGQGVANAVGMAIASKIFASQYKNKENNVDNNIDTKDLCYKVFVVVGDGCLMEGIAQEAMSLAGNLGLDNLVVLFDDNGISIDGNTNFVAADNHINRFKASGWNAYSIDGHNHEEINSILKKATDVQNTKPFFIACKTQIAYGSPNKANTAAAHGAPLGKAEVELVRQKLLWKHDPFIIPEDYLNIWRNMYLRCQKKYSNNEFDNEFDNEQRKYIEKIAVDMMDNFIMIDKPEATRQSSNRCIKAIYQSIFQNISKKHSPLFVGGSADLSTSNCAFVYQFQKDINCVNVDEMTIYSKIDEIIDNKNNPLGIDFSGNYIHYGVREHAMIGIVNGLYLSGFILPYAATFLTFTDYCRPAIRLASIMKLPIIIIATHDSIGVGEDGPTHQPIEHLANLRNIPNLNVFRPADSIETLYCWQLAIKSKYTPSVIALSRQPLTQINIALNDKILNGAYIIYENWNDVENNNSNTGILSDIAIYSTGSEVEIAINAAKKLWNEKKLNIRVISVPCLDIFRSQNNEYKYNILHCAKHRIVIESGISNSWGEFLDYDKYGNVQNFIGMGEYGASGKYQDLYEYFHITTDDIIELIIKILYTARNI